jgi:protease-4
MNSDSSTNQPSVHQSSANQPNRQAGNRMWLIALAVVLGIIFTCTVLPLGGMALLLGLSGGGETGPLPAYSWREEIVSGEGADRITIIEVSGTIGAPADPFSAQLSQNELLSQIRQAREDPLVQAVVLRINSPGGGVVASSELHDALAELSAGEKPLVVSMGSTAASGGYYIATPADKIYANADTFTGSLGVILTLTNVEEAFDTLGLRTYVYKSGALKDIGSPTREPTPEEDAVLQAVVDQAYQGFVDVIVEGRDLPREEVLRLADGRIYTGQQALELGLVDEIGNLDDAIVGARELAGLDRATVVRYTPAASLRALLGSRLQPAPPADPLGIHRLLDGQTPLLEYRWIP